MEKEVEKIILSKKLEIKKLEEKHKEEKNKLRDEISREFD